MWKSQEGSFSVNNLPPESLALLRKHLEVLKECLMTKQPISLKLKNTDIPLPASLTALIVQVLSSAADGKRIVFVEADEEVSPEKAAEFLHVSRPFLIKRLEVGELPFHWVGSHCRILMSDLIEYKRQRRQRSLETLQQMREDAEAMGLYE
jgi:excisionase family DNA binding protein